MKAIAKMHVNTHEVEALIDLQDVCNWFPCVWCMQKINGRWWEKYPALFVVFLGWFEDPYAVHIAMEYIEHGDLGQFIADRGQLAQEGARVIASQILEGLVVLQEREICYRDLKPQVCLIPADQYSNDRRRRVRRTSSSH